MTSRDWTYLTWREKTWGERAQTVLCNIAAAMCGIVIFGFGLWVVGSGVDKIAEHRTERHNCLKHATNGLEIEQCR